MRNAREENSRFGACAWNPRLPNAFGVSRWRAGTHGLVTYFLVGARGVAPSTPACRQAGLTYSPLRRVADETTTAELCG
jgi:hypothetical protein